MVVSEGESQLVRCPKYTFLPNIVKIKDRPIVKLLTEPAEHHFDKMELSLTLLRNPNFRYLVNNIDGFPRSVNDSV